MSLRIWLPMTKDLRNQGLSDVTVTNNGATFDSAGKLGGCYSFDGNDDFISLDGSILYDIIKGGESPFSIAMWIYRADSTRAILFGDYSLSGSIGFNIELNANHSMRFYWNGTPDTSGSHTLATLNAWTHLTITYDGTKICFYTNGTLTDTYAVTLTTKTKTSGMYYLGRDSRTGSTALNGKMNDFRLYDHALSPMEVKELSKGLILHFPLSNNGVGGENLIITNSMAPLSGTSGWNSAGTGWANSNVVSSGASNGHAIRCTYSGTSQVNGGIHHPTGVDKTTLTNGAIYTLSARIRASKACIASFHNELMTTGNSINLTTDWRIYSYSCTIDNTKTYHSNIIYVIASSVEQNMWIECDWIKLEKGSIATPWCPNSSDTLYTTLGYNDNIEYDTSGFGNNGTRVGDFSWSTDTPRYLASTEFSGNSTCIRTSDNNWIARPIEEFTINLWAYKDDWSTYGSQRLFSCTEGAGFNTEQISQSISFPINVYTNEARTSRQYTDSAYRPLIPLSSITSGWHMFTFTYSTSKISSYLDGELVDSKNYTSYGAFCGDNIPLCIGAEATSNFGTAGGHFIGKISDFKLFYTELDSTDILSLYQTSAYIDSQGNTYASSYVEG